MRPGELLLVDSGAQYQDGTTDVTRTVAVGPVPAEAVRPFTLVLKGLIAMCRLRWPAGLAGRDIDAVARVALWRAGMDYDHGRGMGSGLISACTRGRRTFRGGGGAVAAGDDSASSQGITGRARSGSASRTWRWCGPPRLCRAGTGRCWGSRY